MTASGGTRNRPTVVIVGAGAAGIFTAYQINKLWPGQFDAEAALMSAIDVAEMLQPRRPPRRADNVTDLPGPGAIPGRVKSWMEMVLPQAPAPQQRQLIGLIKQLG